MQQDTWNQVDQYFSDKLIPTDPILTQVLVNSDNAGLPPHNVAPNQGKLLQLMAQMCGAKRILEIGTLGAYSTIWLARAVGAQGKVISLEANAKHAEVARGNIELAGLSDRVEIKLGPAIDILPTLQGTFDLIFIDADKPSNPKYLEWALKLSRPGTVIIGDNVVRNGAVTDPNSTDANVIGVRSFFDMMQNNPKLDATALQTVGSKGYDGFSLAIVR